MSSRGDTRGIALLCDARGKLVHVFRDDFDLVRSEATRLHDIIDSASAEKADSFLAATLREGAVFGWELNVCVSGRVLSFQFAGAADGDGIFVAAAGADQSVERLLDDLMAVNNEQANALRSALRERHDAMTQRVTRDHELYEELSKLNNELANAQRELARRGVELARLNEEKNRFLGMAAHDLRNPLGVIYTYAGLLLDSASGRLDASEKESVAEIRLAADYMLQMINDMLDVAKIDAGRTDIAREQIEVKPFLERVLRHCSYAAERKDVELLVEPDMPMQYLTTDSTKLHQIVMNLVNNAVRYSPSGTTVRVAVEKDDDSCTIAVHDQGPGIPAAALDKIFKPFERLGQRDRRGAGLGLLIVKRLVEVLGGAVTVRSEEGKGSSFFVRLPRQ